MDSSTTTPRLRAAIPGSARVFCVVAALALFFAAGATAQDFRSGRSAYNMSDYTRALDHWRPLAERGHADAQAALGFMHLVGLGVAKDYFKAVRWYRRAAAQKQVDALHALGAMHLLGYGVRRDNLHAYVLCEIALSRGEVKGLHCRDRAAQDMTEEQIAIARRRVTEWYSLEGRNWSIN